MAESSVGGKGLCHLTLPGHSPPRREVRTGAQGRDVEVGAEAGAAHRLALHGLLSLLSHQTQARLPKGGLTQGGLALLNQTLINTMPHSSASRPILQVLS